MSGPPDWDDIPPPDERSYGSGSGARKEWKGKGNKPPEMTPEQTAAAVEDFYEWLLAKATRQQLITVLPDHVDLDIFLTTAKTAVLNKPELARDNLRPSLLVAVMKAASQGLLPDGKQGALLPRYNSEKKCQEVSWQPMVWGIVKLGRETGAIQSIRAVIVFHGEKFRVVQGDEDRIEHEVDIDIAEEAYESLRDGKDQWGNPKSNPDAFFSRVRAAYCIIVGTDGLATKRWMTRARLSSLREASKASAGPWNSRWIDEMICKGMILYTSKWLNLDPASATAQRFRAALMTDLEVDFDREGNVAAIGQDEKQAHKLLAVPDTKLDALEQQIFGGLTASVLRNQSSSATADLIAGVSAQQTVPVDPKAAPENRVPMAPETSAAESSLIPPPANDEAPFLERAIVALAIDGGTGHRWVKALEKVTTACPTLGDLRDVHVMQAVQSNLKDAPPEVRSKIADLFLSAQKRLAEIVENEDALPGDR